MLADLGIVALRETHDEIVRMRRLGGGEDLGFAGAELAERDILADGTAEQMHDLADIGDLIAQRATRYACDILAVDQHAA